VALANLQVVLEPVAGVVDLTANFTGAGGPLSADTWQVLAQSEAPEPDALLLLAASVVGLLGCGWRRRKQGA